MNILWHKAEGHPCESAAKSPVQSAFLLQWGGPSSLSLAGCTNKVKVTWPCIVSRVICGFYFSITWVPPGPASLCQRSKGQRKIATSLRISLATQAFCSPVTAYDKEANISLPHLWKESLELICVCFFILVCDSSLINSGCWCCELYYLFIK